MKIAGFLLLISGWGIVVAAVALLSSSSAGPAFVVAGFLVELLGLVLAAYSHRAVLQEVD